MQQSKLSIFILNIVFPLLFVQIHAARLVENEVQVGEGESSILTQFINSAWAIGSMPRFRKNPIRKAVAAGNVERAKDLLRFGADANTRYQNDQTLLHRAVVARKQEMAQLLVREGADVNARCRGGVSVLHRAIQFGREELVSLLLERGADLEAYFPLSSSRFNNLTPLGLAVVEQNEALVYKLLNAGAHPNIPWESNSECIPPLLLAVAVGSHLIAQLLLERGASVSCIWGVWLNVESPVKMAVYKGDLQMLQLLLEGKRGRFSYGGDAPLALAVKIKCDKSEQMVRLLLAHHRYLSQKQQQSCPAHEWINEIPQGATEALDVIIATGNEDIAYLLLEAGVDITKLRNIGREKGITFYSSSFPHYIVDRCGKLPELASIASLAEQEKVRFWIAVKSFLSPNMPRDLQRIVHECLVGKPTIDAMQLQPFCPRQQVVELEA